MSDRLVIVADWCARTPDDIDPQYSEEEHRRFIAALEREARESVAQWRSRADALPAADRELIERSLTPQQRALNAYTAECEALYRERNEEPEPRYPTRFTRKLRSVS
jgi:hypothetical protein